MSSFLAECPQCKNLIAKNTTCPNCNFSNETETAETQSTTLENVEMFARRRRIHNRNFKKSMLLRMIAGLLGLVTAICWCFFIYKGNLIAFVGIGVLTVMSGILGVLVIKCEKMFPVALNCPGCEERLDQLNVSFDKCPGCYSRLT